jgi:hypothetical protein
MHHLQHRLYGALPLPTPLLLLLLLLLRLLLRLLLGNGIIYSTSCMEGCHRQHRCRCCCCCRRC